MAKSRSKTDPLEKMARKAAESALDRKAENVVILDLRGRAGYADFLVIASGTSDRHVQAIAENAEADMAKEKYRAIGREGVREGQWALIDFGAVVLHVFHQFTRDVYQLEKLWKDVPHLSLTEKVKRASASAS